MACGDGVDTVFYERIELIKRPSNFHGTGAPYAFLDNAADKRYFLSGNRNNFAVGSPRTFTLSAQVDS